MKRRKRTGSIGPKLSVAVNVQIHPGGVWWSHWMSAAQSGACLTSNYYKALQEVLLLIRRTAVSNRDRNG